MGINVNVNITTNISNNDSNKTDEQEGKTIKISEQKTCLFSKAKEDNK